MEKRTPKQEINSSLNAPKLGIIWKAYLVVYNLAMFMGWCYVLYITILNFHFEDIGTTYLYWTVRLPLRLVIAFAILQIVHIYAGIGNDTDQHNVARLQMFVYSAIAFVLETDSPASSSIGVPLILFAWSLTEIIRYGYCFFNIIAHYRLFAGLKWTLKLTGIIGVLGGNFCLCNFIWWANKEENQYQGLVVVSFLMQLILFYAQFRYAYCLPSWPRNVIEEKETEFDKRKKHLITGFTGFLALYVHFFMLGDILASNYPSIINHL